jgi:ATP-dependent Lhr-like helicase
MTVLAGKESLPYEQVLRLAVPTARFEPAVQEPLLVRRVERTEEDALRTIVGGWLEAIGPVTAAGLAARIGVPETRVSIGLAQLEQQGAAMRGRYRPGATTEEWCDRALLARIHRLTVGRLRREIEPVTAADFMRFLFRWQHVQPGTHLHGRQGVLEIVSQLQGVELPARAWENGVFVVYSNEARRRTALDTRDIASWASWQTPLDTLWWTIRHFRAKAR